MVRILLFVVIYLLPRISYCISDLHLIIDDSLSIQMRKVITEYTKQAQAVITADFLSSESLPNSIDSTVDIIISVNYNLENSIESRNFANDKLYICMHKNSRLYSSINKIDNLNRILKILSKHSTLMIPSQKLLLGNIVKNPIQKLNIKNYIEIDNLQDLVYSTIKSGGFCILPHSLLSYYHHANIAALAELPIDFYEKINYYISIVSKNNIEKSKKFMNFLISNDYLLRDIGFKVDV